MQTATIIPLIQKHLSDFDPDYGPERWTDDLLYFYIRTALSAISLYDPSATSYSRKLTLQKGMRQSLGAGENILSVHAEDGGYMRMVASHNKSAFPYSVGCTPSKWAQAGVFTVTLDSKEKGVFYVDPPAKGEERVFVTSTLPPIVMDGSIPLSETYLAPMVEYVLSLCYDLEQESSAGSEKSKQHMTNFLAQMGVDSATQLRLEAKEGLLRSNVLGRGNG